MLFSRSNMTNSIETLSVVIPVYNDPEGLNATLKSLFPKLIVTMKWWLTMTLLVTLSTAMGYKKAHEQVDVCQEDISLTEAFYICDHIKTKIYGFNMVLKQQFCK